MKVVLIQDLKGKGKKGDVVEVNSGYALNYLIPNKIAIAGDSGNLNEARQAKQSIAYKDEQNRLSAIDTLNKLKGVTVFFKVKCGETGKVFGSITNADVSGKLHDLGFDIDKKKIELEPIKAIGVHIAHIKLYSGVVASISIDVSAI